MVVVPVLAFAVPALFGHAAIAQDNLIQNFPLRVLTGEQLASGHLPLLNPLANSGTPLLGGMNAGSFFPLTFLFVFLPGVLAWVLNLISVYVAASLGVFVLLRWHGARTYAALVPAMVYAYTGAMMGQLVHLGVVQGYALLPWELLGMFALARALATSRGLGWRSRLRTLAPSVIGLAAVWGLTDLSGEPRAIAEMQLLLLIVGPVVLLVRSSLQPSTWKDRMVYVAGVGVSVVWGALIGLAQLLPGWAFINQSQRTGLSYQWYGAGSLAMRWTSLMLVPDVFGGNGILHQPNYFVNYNLPEVTGYVGLLALVGLFAFLSRWTKRGWRGPDREWIVYVVLVVVGLVATWGSFTPLGHVFQHLPLYGSTRLQSRNIVVVDLGLTMLLGWFLQHLAEREFATVGLTGRRRWITLSPVLLVAAFSLAMLFAGPAIVGWMSGYPASERMAGYEKPTLLLHLAMALGFAWCLWWGLHRRSFLKWLTGLVVLDVVLFVAFCSTGFVAGNANLEPLRSYVATQIDGNGRFALVDPSGSNDTTFEDLGGANMNVFTRIPSVQGYGSLIDQLYGAVTNTHPLYGLDGCQLARGVYHQLRLSTVVISGDKLATLVKPGLASPPLCAPTPVVVQTSRYFGRSLAVASVTISGPPSMPVTVGVITAQLINAVGAPIGPAVNAVGAPTMRFDFSRTHRVAAGVRLTSSSGELVRSAIVRTGSGSAPSYQLDTPFQQALSSSAWRYRKTVGTLSYFQATTVRPGAWTGSNAGSSRITNITNAIWGDSWVTIVATHPTIVKRSMEWIPGWRATAVNLRTGKNVKLHVVRSGLIQQVVVPAGEWKVHFHYHAPHIEIGIVGSIAGVLALLGSVAALRGWVPRRRKGRVSP